MPSGMFNSLRWFQKLLWPLAHCSKTINSTNFSSSRFCRHRVNETKGELALKLWAAGKVLTAVGQAGWFFLGSITVALNICAQIK